MKPWIPETGVTVVAAPEEIQLRAELDPRAANVRAFLIAAAIVSTIVAFLLPTVVGMAVNWTSFLQPLVALAPVAVLWPWARWRRRLRAQAAAELVLLPLLLSLPVLIFSYSAMRVGFPLQDARLESWDSALGFRALDFIGWLDGHRTLSKVLRFSYGTFFPQTAILTIMLVVAGRLERAYAMSLAILMMGVIGASVCMFFPAVGVYVHHGIPQGFHPSSSHGLGYFSAQLQAVRTSPAFVLDLTKADGIVAFPSGHAAIAILCAWAAWPLRWVRWPFLALNAAMFVSAIPQGAHYLVDLIAGAAMAMAAILIATQIPQRVRVARLFQRRDATPFNQQTVSAA